MKDFIILMFIINLPMSKGLGIFEANNNFALNLLTWPKTNHSTEPAKQLNPRIYIANSCNVHMPQRSVQIRFAKNKNISPETGKHEIGTRKPQSQATVVMGYNNV